MTVIRRDDPGAVHMPLPMPAPRNTPDRYVIGIDPGKMGGAVVLDSKGAYIDSKRSDREFVSESTYQTAAMAAFLREYQGVSVLVLLERQHAMPDFAKKKGDAGSENRKQGNSSIFATGFGFGLWQGLICGVGLPLELVTAQAWQSAILRGIPGDTTKARAAQVAQNRVPGLPLVPPRGSKPHSGLADAACLALHGLTRFAQ